MTAFAGFLNKPPYYTPWEQKFIFLKKINDKWIFCRRVYRRRHLYAGMAYGELYYQYALNEFEIIKYSDKD